MDTISAEPIIYVVRGSLSTSSTPHMPPLSGLLQIQSERWVLSDWVHGDCEITVIGSLIVKSSAIFINFTSSCSLDANLKYTQISFESGL